MVFSSLIFLCAFLPVTIIIYHLLIRLGAGRASLVFLFLASLFYYGYWKPSNTWIILASIIVNYGFGIWISQANTWRKPLFIAGVAINLAALGYYKYTDFLITNINTLLDSSLPLTHIILPIGISFFTFQQISYLADIYSKEHDPSGQGLIDYCLFVCFFPQLVAGPIVHHREMMPQFASEKNLRLNWGNMYAGLCMLSIGLAKKVLIADSLAPVVSATLKTGVTLSAADALLGTFATTAQIYYDFSGYSDMAIGCALFFNICLPQNFFSPFKAVSIQDFWRRWHVTLSRWLRDYLYFALGGSKCAPWRSYLNLFLTFFIGGIWHGASWCFVLWGLCHGIALVIHRFWTKQLGLTTSAFTGWALTFSLFLITTLLGRAPSLDALTGVFQGLAGFNGLGFTPEYIAAIKSATYRTIYAFEAVVAICVGAYLIAFFAPNSTQIVSNATPRLRLTLWVAFLLGLCITALTIPEKTNEFIYFQF